MKMSENENYLNINLFNGNSYSDSECFEEKKSNCQITSKFDIFSLKLDLSSFKLNRGNSDRFSNKAKTMDISQLKTIIDSIQKILLFKKMILKKKFSLQNISHQLKPKKKN